MRRKNYLITLLLAAALILSMTAMSWAASKEFTGSVTYTGGKSIQSSYDSNDLAAEASDLEPGDDITITIQYNNRSSKTTDWFLRNSVIQTLEESGTPAENGGYTYILTDSNVGEIYNNSEVGGEKVVNKLEGLKQATNATKDFFFVQELKPGKSQTTTLHVELDGETGLNSYMDTQGALLLKYAVEDKDKATTPSRNPSHPSRIKTGDMNRMIYYVMLFSVAALLLVLAIILWVRDRKRGEDA